MATPIEQQLNGVDNMIYMKSLNTSDGRMLLDVSFQVGMDLDTANVLTQNRVITSYSIHYTKLYETSTARSEDPAPDTMAIVREAVRADKKALVASNLIV